MGERFFSETALNVGSTARLEGSEAHHLLHVMRAKVGDPITLFDGHGSEYSAEVTQLSRREVELSVIEAHPADRELGVSLTLGVALPKGDRQRFLVEKLTELGVTELVPLLTERSGPAPKGNAIEKLRRSVIEASKQCRRNRLMKICDPVQLDSFLNRNSPTVRWFAHPSGAPLANDLRFDANQQIAIAIGPEGGFSEAEHQAAREADWEPIGLGERILRIETAAMVTAFTVTQACG